MFAKRYQEMKRILLIALTVVMQLPLNAQKLVTDGFLLPEDGVVSVTFDYGKARLKDMPFTGFCDLNPEFLNEKKDAEKRFIERMNNNIKVFAKESEATLWGGLKKTNRHFRGEKTSVYDVVCNLIFLPDKDASVMKIVVIPSAVDSDGNFSGVVVLTNGAGESATIEDVKGKGGTFGSFVNLMGDGFESAADKICRVIVRAIIKDRL